VADQEGRAVTGTAMVHPGDTVTVHVTDGKFEASVIRVMPQDRSAM